MLISLLVLLLISNALTLRKDKSILFSRVVMITLIHTSFLAYNNLYFLSLDKGIGIFGGLFHVTAYTQVFNIFVLVLSSLILTLTSFSSRKVTIDKIALLFYYWRLKYYYRNIKIAFKFLDYSMVLLVATLALFIIGIYQINFVKLFCIFSNLILIALLLKKDPCFKNDIGILARIKLLFYLDKEKINYLFTLLLFTWTITIFLRILVFNRLNSENIFLMLYAQLVVYPYVVLILNTTSQFLASKRNEVFTLSFFKKVLIKTSQSVTFKNLAVYILVWISGRILMSYLFTCFIGYVYCDAQNPYLWMDKQVIVKGSKIQVEYLNRQTVRKLDRFNLVEHKNILDMELAVKQLNEIILGKNIPEVALTAPHFLNLVNTDVNVISDYMDFERNNWSNDPKVQNFKHFLEVPCSTFSENLNVEGYIENKENYVLIPRDRLKTILYDNNRVRLHNYGLLTLSRALVLDNMMYNDTYLNPIVDINSDLNRINQEFKDYKYELNYLNLALQQYLSGNFSGQNFTVFQKRQISYHMDAYTKLLEDEKYGSGLNPNYEVINNNLVKSKYTRGQHKTIIRNMLFKFLIPSSNDFALRVRDFTNPDQVYQELVENMLYVQLNYLVRYKSLELINNSEKVLQLLNGDTLPIQQRSKILAELNSDLEKSWREFLEDNTRFYKHLDYYYRQRVLDYTDFKCRQLSLQNTVDLHHFTSYCLENNNYSSQKWGIGLTSRLGLNRAREFAYDSPFIDRYDKTLTHSTRKWVNTYSYIGMMAYRNRILD